jgi:hypothetical protein
MENVATNPNASLPGNVRRRDQQCYIDGEPFHCPDCGGNTLASWTVDHQPSGDQEYWVIAEDVETGDGWWSVCQYDEYLTPYDPPDDGDGGAWWEDMELVCCWCGRHVEHDSE